MARFWLAQTEQAKQRLKCAFSKKGEAKIWTVHRCVFSMLTIMEPYQTDFES
jgi:hypothetical protein